MSNPITLDDIDEKVRSHIFNQTYEQTNIDGVQLITLKHVIGDEGDFSEIMKFSDNGEYEAIPGFKIAQINRTRIFPKSIKAWHLHFKQDEFWYTPPAGQLFVGLWDLRKNSSTVQKKLRVNLGGGISKILFVPRGVAHGCMNLSETAVELFYFTSQRFDIQNPDEQRIHWDAAGKDFWSPERD